MSAQENAEWLLEAQICKKWATIGIMRIIINILKSSSGFIGLLGRVPNEEIKRWENY